MAQSYTTDDGIVLVNPGTYVAQKVVNNPSGTPTVGVVTIVGEADEGPHWSDEENLDDNSFGPDQANDVINKYGSGRIVDAFRAAAAPANDPVIIGAPQLIKIVKTNVSLKAAAVLTRDGIGAYATFTDKKGGVRGNLVKYKSEIAQAEVAPAIVNKTYAPLLTGSAAVSVRLNGGSPKSVSVPAVQGPEAFVASIEDLSLGILANGGVLRAILSGKAGVNISAAPVAGNLVVTLAAGQTFAASLALGHTVVIPNVGQYGAVAPSVISGGAQQNVGSYVVQSFTNTLANASMVLKPVNVTSGLVAASGAISAAEDDLSAWTQVTITNKTGQARDVADALNTDWASISNDGTNIVFGITEVGVEFNSQAKSNDTLVMSSDFLGIAPGFYQVVSADETTISAFRLSAGSSVGVSSGTATGVTAPIVVSKPDIDGLGKAMETTGNWDGFLVNSDGTPASVGNSLFISSAEYVNKTTVARDIVVGEFVAGGDIALKIGSSKSGAQLVIGASSAVLSDNSGVILTIAYTQVKTLQDMVGLINAQTGYSATLQSGKFMFLNPAKLDKGTYTLVSSIGAQPARIKNDANAWLEGVSQSAFVTTSMTATAGLPEVVANFQFLNGGTKGGTTAAAAVQGIDACMDVTTNFVVSLFSVDSNEDIASGATDSASTYTIDAINAAMRSHVIAASQYKTRQNRTGFVSKEAAYADQKEAASDSNSFRIVVSFLNVKVLSSAGVVVDYQPWMHSVISAGAQAAAGYKGLVKKGMNVSGLYHKNGDYNVRSNSQKEDALKAGLLVSESVNTGGFRWTSDQTSYTADNNFVFNSIQAVYVADIMTLDLIDTFDRQVVGQSVADISAGAALSLLEAKMFDYKRLKFITSSSDAVKGYKNASVRIKGGVLSINIEVKLAGLIYFVPISFSISEVSQEASQ